MRSQLKPLSFSLGIGFVGGLAQAIATPPYGLWPLAWFALMPLWYAVLTPQKLVFSLVTAIAWGLAYNAITLHWLLDLHPLTWMGVPYVASLGVTLLCWLFVILWVTAMVVLWVWVLRGLRQWLRGHGQWANGVEGSSPIAWLLLGAGLWCLFDSLWGSSPLYWNPLALSQSPHNKAILHLAQWGGPQLITGLLVGINGLWVLAGQSLGRQRHRWLLGTLLLLLISHGLGGLLWLQPLSQEPEKRLRIGIIQGNVPTRIKLTTQGIQTALEHYSEGYRQLDQEGVDAVLMPEGAFPFVWDVRNPQTQPLTEALGQAIAWVGAFGQEGAAYSQSLLSLEPSSSQSFPGAQLEPRARQNSSTRSNKAPHSPEAHYPPKAQYNKVKLVPLGEYIPLERTLGAIIDRLSPLPSGMVPGELGQRFETALGHAAVQICYEPAFSEVLRRQVAQGAEFVLSSANLDPYGEVLMAQSEAHDVMRAIESDRWIVRASNTGYSGFIEPHGQVLWRAPARTFSYHSETIARRQSLTVYSRWGNWIVPEFLGLGLATLSFDFLRRRRA